MERVAGTIKIGWSIAERDLGLDQVEGELSPKQVVALCDRIEEAVAGAVPQEVEIFVDGEDRPPVQVLFEVVSGFTDLEIDDGPVNGMIDELREEAQEEEENDAE